MAINKGSAGRSVKADLLGCRIDPVDGKLVTLDDLRQKYPENDNCILVELHMYQIEDYWRDVCAEITIFHSTPKCMIAGFLKQASMDSAPQARCPEMQRWHEHVNQLPAADLKVAAPSAPEPALKEEGKSSPPQFEANFLESPRLVVMPRQSPSPQLGDVARPFASCNHSFEMKWKTGSCFVPQRMSATAKVIKVPANSVEFSAKVTKVPANSAEFFPEFSMGA